MPLRPRLLLYVVALHIALVLLSLVALLALSDAGVIERSQRPWIILGIEAVVIACLVLGTYLVGRALLPVQLVQSGAELIGEADFTTHLRPVGEPATDRLIDVYNTMIDRLREERLRHEEQNLFLDRVLRASPAGVVTLDFEGRIAQANPAAERMLGTRTVAGLTLAEVGGPLASAMA
ncbi:MAG TPA: PAS domain-containing protein, partial [Candidatus Polarisedimenticolaceae bacterium]|nr:PAS domain-containing protein [Candidatus Polarisedimenticolaceae bacterium]